MMKFVGTDGNKYYNWNLSQGRFVVGRSSDADFVINHKTVSRNHAVIELSESGEVTVEDLDSRNGTLINGQTFTGKKPIAVEDVVMLGQAEFRLSTSDISEHRKPLQTARLSEHDPEKSVFLPIKEALKPLPSKVTELPEVLPTIFEMAKILVLPEPKEDMLAGALKLIAKVIKGDRLAILATGDNDDIITLATILPEGKDPGTFRLSRTIVSEILSNNNAILIDPLDDPKFASQDSIVLSHMKSAMAVPLFDGGNVLGILYIDTTNPLHIYNNDYLRLLATFGNLIASRLLNYELMYERQQKEIFETELRRASMIQRNLLIKEIPEFSGYDIYAFQEQCRMVGGDLYDVVTLSDGRLLFTVADVSGKGMGAALLTSNILASLRILYGDENFDLCRVVKQVSIQLFKYSGFEDFATMFIGILDQNDGSLAYVNAGHNPPILQRADGTYELLDACGTMIGAFDFSDWPLQNATLNPKDKLIVFTDGVVEADHEGAFYGEERLEKLVVENNELPPKEILEEIMKDVLSFVKDSPRSDDITMLAVKRN